MDAGPESAGWRIRKANAADKEDIEAVAANAFSIYLRRMERKPFPLLDDYAAHIRSGHAFVLEETDEQKPNGVGGICAFAVLAPGADELALEVLAVSRRRQGRGYGRAFIDFARRQARALGARRIGLYTNEVMRESQGFYESLGFTETRRALDSGYRRVFYALEVEEQDEQLEKPLKLSGYF